MAMALGVYVMDTVQLAVGSSAAPHVLPEITNPLPRPLGTVSAPVVAPPSVGDGQHARGTRGIQRDPLKANVLGVMVRAAGTVAVAVIGRLNGLPPTDDAVKRPDSLQVGRLPPARSQVRVHFPLVFARVYRCRGCFQSRTRCCWSRRQRPWHQYRRCS